MEFNLSRPKSIPSTRVYSTVKLWEFSIPLLASVSLLISCFLISSKEYFENDELFSFYLLTDASFVHMWEAFQERINNTPPLYFFIGWFWSRVFGPSELSLRLFSSLSIGTACFITWFTLRQTYSFAATSIGVLGAFCGSTIAIAMNAEARMYGLFLAVCSLGLLSYSTLSERTDAKRGMLLLTFLVHTAIVQTHLFGGFFSAAILSALIVGDFFFHRFRPNVYFSIVLGWTTFLLYLPAFIRQADVGNPRTWLYVPGWRDLFDVLSLSEYSYEAVTMKSSLIIILLLLLVLGAGFYIINLVRRRVSDLPNAGRTELSVRRGYLLLLAYAFLAIPVFVWVVSHTIKPMFYDRYFIPIILGWTILFTHLLAAGADYIDQLFIQEGLKPARTVLRVLLISTFCFTSAYFLAKPIIYTNERYEEELPGTNDTAYGYDNLPIVTQLSHDFVRRVQYSPEWSRYYFLLDWRVAVDSTSGLFPPQEYKHMESLKRVYPNRFRNVIQGTDFLKTHRQFLVLTNPDYTRECSVEPTFRNYQCLRWLSMVILPDNRYKVTPLGDVDDRVLLLVDKVR